MNNTEQFTGKYEKSGRIARLLVNHFFKELIKLIPESDAFLLEIGCGAGYSTERLVSSFPRMHIEASDVDEELVHMARKHNPQVSISVESIYDLKRGTNSADIVLALEVFEHLEEPEKALQELHRVTAKYAVISVPREPIWRILNMLRGKYWSSFGNTYGHLNHWSTHGVTKFVQPLFTVVETRTPLPWTILLLKKNDPTSSQENIPKG